MQPAEAERPSPRAHARLPAAWRYASRHAARDDRIDLLRGLVMLVILVNHVALPSLFHVLSVEAVGVVTGAEAFVLLSGLILGVVHGPRFRSGAGRDATRRLLRRAWQLYAVAAVTSAVVYAVGLALGNAAASLTTYTDPRTQQTFSLYGNAPDPAELAWGLVTLAYGPGALNVLGLYVALVLIAPALLWALRRGWWLPLLALSWAVYAAFHADPPRVLPSQSENAFPVLAWQVLFVHGVTAGYHRAQLGRFARGTWGRVTLGAAGALTLALAFFALNNPWYDIPGGLRLHLIPEDVYFDWYAGWFQRAKLGLGRVVNTFALLTVLYALLTVCWVPVERALGRLLIPIGRATLYVFVVHLAFVLLAAQFPALQRGHVLLNTAAHAAVIAVTWWLVTRRVLFRVIPR